MHLGQALLLLSLAACRDGASHACLLTMGCCFFLPPQDSNMEAGMLRKMEKGMAEETSLLEFIKSKGLAHKGKGEQGLRLC